MSHQQAKAIAARAHQAAMRKALSPHSAYRAGVYGIPALIGGFLLVASEKGRAVYQSGAHAPLPLKQGA